MKIDFKNKNIISLIAGISIVFFIFLYVHYNDYNDPSKLQIENIKNDISNKENDIASLNQLEKKDMGGIKQNYINFVKDIIYLAKFTPEIETMGVTFLNSPDGYLKNAIKTDINPSIKYIDCEAQILLKSESEEIDFYTLYKPLSYFEKISLDKYTIEVKEIMKNDKMYKINFKILGKEDENEIK